ncbi:MAG: hypothetical protein ABII06_20240 [Pseudomonadota bacterium]
MEGTNTGELLKKPYLNEVETAAVTGRAVATLRNERHLCRGIPYLKVGGRSIRYKLQDVLSYMERRRITFDDVPGGAA